MVQHVGGLTADIHTINKEYPLGIHHSTHLITTTHLIIIIIVTTPTTRPSPVLHSHRLYQHQVNLTAHVMTYHYIHPNYVYHNSLPSLQPHDQLRHHQEKRSQPRNLIYHLLITPSRALHPRHVIIDPHLIRLHFN